MSQGDAFHVLGKSKGPKTYKSFAAAVLCARERAREMRRANLGRMGGLSDRRSFSSSSSSPCRVVSPAPAQNRPCDDDNEQRTSAWAATTFTNNRRAEYVRVIKLVFWSSAFTPPPSLPLSLHQCHHFLLCRGRQTDGLGRCRRRRLSHSYCIKVFFLLGRARDS